jgi:hypothetical protein
LFEVLETLAYRPWLGTAPSAAALYRMLAGAPTLLVDEVEIFSHKNKSESTQLILAVLNAGHRKGATIPRCEPPKHRIRHFPVYGPKAFAAIGRLPDTLADRSIIVTMQRRTKKQTLGRFRMARAKTEATPIKDAVSRFAAAHQTEIEQAYHRVVDMDMEYLNDRDADLWSPLFAMCVSCSPERIAELKECAITLSKAKAGDDADNSLSLKLLIDIRTVWPNGKQRCYTAALVQLLQGLEDSPWGQYELSGHKLAAMLRPYEVTPREMRIDNGSNKNGYEFSDLDAAFDRYLDETRSTSATSQ